jgi:formylmethanofuran dehydrogenase subunit E
MIVMWCNECKEHTLHTPREAEERAVCKKCKSLNWIPQGDVE